MLKYRVPASNAVGDFSKLNSNGSVFYDKSKFNFVANNVSYRTLINEMVNSMGYTPEMIESQLQMFRASVNKDPDSFRVPEDNGDPFFKKLNLGLLLINKSGGSAGIISRLQTVINWMNSYMEGDEINAAFMNAINAYDQSALQSLYLTLTKLAQLYNTNGGNRPNGVVGRAMGPSWGVLSQAFPERQINGAGVWAGNNMDLLHVLVANVFPAQSIGGRVLGENRFNQNEYHRSVLAADASAILANISNRLIKDAFFRESNFREVLQEVGMSMEEFERLVENATTTIYWPDCIGSKSSPQDMIYLIKGLGIYKEGMEQMSKAELCSFILTSMGYKPENFAGNFNRNDILSVEDRTNMDRIIAAIRRPDAGALPNGYLGNINAAAAPLTGAYLLTAYAAHNVTMDKAVQWLKAAGVDSATQIGFINYAKNENVFDLISTRTEQPKSITMNMDYTKDMLARKYRNQAINI